MNSEMRIMKKKKRSRKQQANSVFALILSALFRKSDTHKPLIKKCLNKIYISLPHSLSAPILSLLPATLKSSCCEIACISAEIIGAASLESLEMNEKIAMEAEIVKGIISLLGNSKRETATAACNAILDLSTTSIGRERLLECNAVDNLFLCFIQASKSSAVIVSVAGDTLLFSEDEYLISLLQGSINLINSCTIEMLKNISMELSGPFLLYLKGLWIQVHNLRLCDTSSKYDKRKHFYKSNINTNNLIVSIFRLSINHSSYPGHLTFGFSEKTILDFGVISTEQFVSTIWESSPMLTRGSRNFHNIFGPFTHYLGPKESIPTFIPSMLKSFISCPSIASDELDILNVLKEIKNNLGSPITYHRDIRVLKTNLIGRESHCFQEQSCSSHSKNTHILNTNEILKCEEAFNNGYSIALRGLEFRFQTIAVIADELASFFGQPSVGVNMYLTPSNSQGLARHSDDHCVFVCQLAGVKKWKIFPKPTSQLPRLYEPFDGFKAECETDDGCQEFLLKEGDVLYIPRGFPHEAKTRVNSDEFDDGTGFSLHLTFAVEIELPFEWEGFMHIALYTWNGKQKSSQHTDSSNPIPHNLHRISITLLHVVIKLLGNLDSTFRKACLVGAAPTSFVTRDFIHDNEKTIFKYLISKITESKISDVIQHVETVLQKNEDPLECLSWMKYLKVEGEIEKFYDFEVPSPDNRYVFDLFVQNRDIVESAFVQIKCRFCSEVELEDGERHYKLLLDKYRKVRKEYANGMLSLHCIVGNEHNYD